ncbi:MAG: methyltransferase domain-containing protein [Actinomycetota bacterium]|nr:methyltransferase domain-containing protein [Actinomycetota bacterium]
MTDSDTGTERLVCPTTNRGLSLVPLAEAEARVAGGRPLTARRRGPVPPVGPTPLVLVREDDACAYPFVDGTAILLGPERLADDHEPEIGDLSDRRYAEAYQEMAFYDEVASRDEVDETARELIRATDAARQGRGGETSPPWPHRAWIDATFEPAAQWDAFQHLAPMADKTLAQLGGKGVQAVKFLLAGAAEAWLVTPMLGEIDFARRLARHVGVSRRFRAVVAVAEELPFPDGSLDAMYAGSTAHHMITELAFREVARVLGPGGRFAAVEPWKAPFYNLGIAVFGKRESVGCRPMTAERAAPLGEAFEATEIVHHGALSRYPLLGLSKLGVPIGLPVVSAITRVDDAVCSVIPRFRQTGSSAALLAIGGRPQPRSGAATLDGDPRSPMRIPGPSGGGDT